MKVKIRVADISGVDWQEIEAEPVSFPGFREFSFCIDCRKSGWWVITEMSTGYSVGPMARTREGALVSAYRALKKAGVERVKTLIQERLP